MVYRGFSLKNSDLIAKEVKNMEVSAVLEKRRQERGITVAELARRTDVNYDVLSRSLKGQTMPKGDQLLRLCKELNLEFADFY